MGGSGGSEPLLGPTGHIRKFCMDNSRAAGRQHGLTLVQWGLLLVAFMLGIGCSFVVREFFPPAHAGVIQSAPLSPDSAR
jgi:hypothetical protein